MLFSILSLFWCRALHAQEARRVNQDAKIFVDIPGIVTDTIVVRGTADMQWSDTTVFGHYVTLGSMATYPWFRHFEDGYVGGIAHRIDFMDPAGGGSQDGLNFEVDANDSGKPTIKKYKLLEGISTGDAVISGFISVSPPEDGGKRPCWPPPERVRGSMSMPGSRMEPASPTP